MVMTDTELYEASQSPFDSYYLALLLPGLSNLYLTEDAVYSFLLSSFFLCPHYSIRKLSTNSSFSQFVLQTFYSIFNKYK